jgi:hypothetical protein
MVRKSGRRLVFSGPLIYADDQAETNPGAVTW